MAFFNEHVVLCIAKEASRVIIQKRSPRVTEQNQSREFISFFFSFSVLAHNRMNKYQRSMQSQTSPLIKSADSPAAKVLKECAGFTFLKGHVPFSIKKFKTHATKN